jgi:formylglycine-generating enzyme required for sulfatase activity
MEGRIQQPNAGNRYIGANLQEKYPVNVFLRFIFLGLMFISVLSSTSCLGLALRDLEKGWVGKYIDLKKAMTPPPSGSGRLFVYVPGGGPNIMNTFGELNRCTVNEHVYRIFGATYWYIDIPAGKYLITADGIKYMFSGRYGNNRVSFDLKEGETKYCKINIEAFGMLAKYTPIMVEPIVAERELENLEFYGNFKTNKTVPGEKPKEVEAFIASFSEDKRLIKEKEEAKLDGRVLEDKIIENKEMPKTLTNSIGMGFVLIPAGKFVMGTPDNEPGRRKNEGPQHEVIITKSFYMGKYEVKVSEFREFIKATGYKTEAEKTGGAFIRESGRWEKKEGIYWGNPGFNQNDNHPVTCVSWNDVLEFCKWLTIKTGYFYRLPTEAEWEYACRAGSQEAFSFGSDAKALGTYAWFRDNAGGQTHPVGQKEPNAWGLYDMHGNVREISQDWYGNYRSGSVVDPDGPYNGQRRIWRGGGWAAPPADCRCGERSSGPQAEMHFRLGFRLVMSNF